MSAQSTMDNLVKIHNISSSTSLTIPRGTTPGYIPGDISVDGQTLKFRAEDYSVVTVDTNIPPSQVANLQNVTTAGNTTTIGISVTAGGVTVNGGGIQNNTSSTFAVNDNVVVNSPGGTLSLLTTVTPGLSEFRSDISFMGGTNKIINTSGNLTLDPFADLVLAPLGVGGLVKHSGLLNITSSAAINFTTPNSIVLNSQSGDVYLRPPLGGFVRIDGSIGSSSYRNFQMTDTVVYGKGDIPTLTDLNGTSNHFVSPGSNQLCGRISFKAGLSTFACLLTLPHPNAVGGDLACFLSPCNSDDDFYDAIIHIDNTNSALGFIVIGGNLPTVQVTLDMYYWIVGMI